MDLPPAFVRTLTATYDDGAAWLDNLPALLDEFAARWELILREPFPLSYHYVCAATRLDGSDVVLKAGVPNPEGKSELAALQLWKGAGVVQVLEADAARGVFLMERLDPGTPIRALYPERDDEATRIAARTMKALWTPVENISPLIPLADYVADLADLRPHFGGGTGPFSEQLVTQAEEVFAHAQGESVLLHGDLHHDNLLRHGQEWRVIDPKGVVGDPAFDVGAWLYNFWDRPLDRAMLRRRVVIFAEELGMTRERVAHWGLAASVLSAWWSYDTRLPEGGNGWRSTLAVAEALLEEVS